MRAEVKINLGLILRSKMSLHMGFRTVDAHCAIKQPTSASRSWQRRQLQQHAVSRRIAYSQT